MNHKVTILSYHGYQSIDMVVIYMCHYQIVNFVFQFSSHKYGRQIQMYKTVQRGRLYKKQYCNKLQVSDEFRRHNSVVHLLGFTGIQLGF